jgi:sulfate adenylyltransferase subunit 2
MMKAFHPGKPFPLLHVDTNWKFREMIAFAISAYANSASICWSMSTPTESSQGIDPFSHARRATPT